MESLFSDAKEVTALVWVALKGLMTCSENLGPPVRMGIISLDLQPMKRWDLHAFNAWMSYCLSIFSRGLQKRKSNRSQSKYLRLGVPEVPHEHTALASAEKIVAVLGKF